MVLSNYLVTLKSPEFENELLSEKLKEFENLQAQIVECDKKLESFENNVSVVVKNEIFERNLEEEKRLESKIKDLNSSIELIKKRIGEDELKTKQVNLDLKNQISESKKTHQYLLNYQTSLLLFRK